MYMFACPCSIAPAVRCCSGLRTKLHPTKSLSQTCLAPTLQLSATVVLDCLPPLKNPSLSQDSRLQKSLPQLRLAILVHILHHLRFRYRPTLQQVFTLHTTIAANHQPQNTPGPGNTITWGSAPAPTLRFTPCHQPHFHQATEIH